MAKSCIFKERSCKQKHQSALPICSVDVPFLLASSLHAVMLPLLRHGGDDHGHSHGDDNDNVAVQAALAHVIGDIAPWIFLILRSLKLTNHP